MEETITETVCRAVGCASAFVGCRLDPAKAPKYALGLLETLGEDLAILNSRREHLKEYHGLYAVPPEFQNLPGASYHDKGWGYAIKVYRRAFNQKPYCQAGESTRNWATIHKCWTKVVKALHEIPEIDASRLADCIRDESAKAKRRNIKSDAQNELNVDKETLALATLALHPEWSDIQIAKAAGCNRTSLYRWEKYSQAREILNQNKNSLPRGIRRKTAQ